MGNTPNNNFPFPESTDLVKDGAQAIEDLAASIDTKLGVYSTPGMVKLASVAFSAVASQSFNDVFSTTYNHYKIIGFFIGSTSAAVNIRLRVAGADDSTSNYDTQRILVDNTSVTGTRASAASSGQFSTVRSTANASFEMTVFNPFATEQTNFISANFDPIDNAVLMNNVGRFRLTTSFTGFTALTSSGTMTGSISVFGVNK
jgi:hypothetical protein